MMTYDKERLPSGAGGGPTQEPETSPGRAHPGRARLGLAGGLALVIFLLTVLVAWQTNGWRILIPLESKIITDWSRFRHGLEAYQKQGKPLPATLEEVNTALGGQYLVPRLDPWGRPYHYAVEQGEYRFWTEGRDGQPGGVGWDGDFTCTKEGLVESPSVPLGQFLTAPESRPALGFCLATGIVAGLILLVQLRPAAAHPPHPLALIISLVAIIGASMLLALFLSVIYLPSTH